MLNIITNTASMAASRSLNRNNKALAQSFQRLSTGLRINSAKDDAAGLAISNRLTSQFRGLNQAARNANDSISMLQTADSAISEQQNMLQRLRELAVQASSDTNSAADRTAIQTEANALMSEIDRIASQTSFNGRNLLDGSVSGLEFQVGAYESQTVSVTLKGTRNYSLGSLYSFTTSTVDATNALAAGDLTFGGVGVRASVAGDDTLSSSGNDASAIAKAAAINAGTADHGVTAEVNSTVYTGGAITTASVAAGTYSINGVNIGAHTILANDSDSSLRDAINQVTSQTGVVASLDGSNQLVLTATDGRNVVVAGTVTGTGLTAGTYGGTITLKNEDGQIAASGANEAYVGMADASTVGSLSAVNVSNLDFSSQTNADAAIGAIDDAISQLNDRQATIGALLNRMDNAVSSLSAAAENVAAARGQIRDADFAAETAAFSKNQILQQASASMLAQANVQGQLALQLLG